MSNKTLGLIGRKIGMTSVFNDNGQLVPVTVVEAAPNRITQIKTLETDGYHAIQLTAGSKRPSRVTQPLKGHFAKANVVPGDMLAEFPVCSIENFTLGQEVSAIDIFSDISHVDVRGTSKGKGFAGAVKRHNFRTQDATHGNSKSHRAPGSIGQNQSPGRVFKNKKMAGQLGNVLCSVQNVKLVKVDAEKNIMLINGSIPGAPGTRLIIRPAVKTRGK